MMKKKQTHTQLLQKKNLSKKLKKTNNMINK